MLAQRTFRATSTETSLLHLGIATLLAIFPSVQSAGAEPDTAGYWQQEVRYVIHASLDETNATLSGREAISYINRSPDTLTSFFLHLYLNAFRPGSRWADRDSIEGSPRFNDLEDPDYAFERVSRIEVNGVAVAPEYPYAPDSTILRIALPEALVPEDSMNLSVQWQARPSTLPRRQGRRGRRYDFAQWYPRVVVYDRGGWQDHPLYPAGEFYGEFATYDVTFDVAEDQVIGSTGVPVEGDPGWERAKADPTLQIDYQRDWYSPLLPPPPSPPPAPRGGGRGEQGGGCGEGRKCVRFYAEDVHHFAWSVNPEYVYEEGRFEDVVVRVLYLPGEQATWGDGVAVGRTIESLRWLKELFGPYPWPQLTNLHRIEGGGTEFPMVIMDGGASMGLILHETGHQYLMGILANNEWRHGFLDEGFSSFQGAWWGEEQTPGSDAYASLAASILQFDLDGWSEPINRRGEDFRDFATYGVMTYSKAQLFYFQLRYVLGRAVMRAVLREYYDRWKLKHVTPDALRDVAEDVSGMELGWLFDQWLNQTPLIDFAIGTVERRELPDGSWETSVEVLRKGDGWMPVEIGERDRPVIYARSTGLDRTETVTFRTAEKPGRLMLDPRVRSHDWNFTNNREAGLFDLADARYRLDTFVEEPAARDRRVLSIAPTLWWNDASDATVGVRVRQNYLGRFDKRTWWVGRGVSGVAQTTEGPLDFSFSWENPIFLRSDRASQLLEGWSRDGTVGARARFSRERRSSFTSPSRHRVGWMAQWVATRQTDFLDPALWDNGGTVELGRLDDWNLGALGARWKASADARAGVTYSRVGGRTGNAKPFLRVTATGSSRRPLGAFVLGTRFFAGAYVADDLPALQRAIPLNGADPYQTLENPFVRTQGALLVQEDLQYHSPGNGNLRGFRRGLGGRWVLAANIELERYLFRRPSGVVRSVAVVGFADGALVDTVAVRTFSGTAIKAVSDGGMGVRIGLHVGDLTFPLRIEFPFIVSDPRESYETIPGDNRLGFRWLISLQPIF
ncbi:MAG: M1 family metallopeptidase [Gemmatimonadetes bacterium]|nr:M1 family metallopeptidase [Gemmatimonadota bacterium]